MASSQRNLVKNQQFSTDLKGDEANNKKPTDDEVESQQKEDASFTYLTYHQKRLERERKESHMNAEIEDGIKWNASQRPNTDYHEMQESFRTFKQVDLRALERHNLLRNVNLQALAQKSKTNLNIDPTNEEQIRSIQKLETLEDLFLDEIADQTKDKK